MIIEMALPQLIPSPSSSTLPHKPLLNPIRLSLNPNFPTSSPQHLNILRHHRRRHNSTFRCSASSFSERHHMNSSNSDDVVELPLFPLPLVLFPGAVLPLQIFEFRYRIMMHTLLQTDLRFGVIYTDAVSGTADVGCVGEVIKHERLVDDRFFLICKGQERFRVTGVVRTKPYLVAQVTWLEDRPSPSTELDLEGLATEVETYMKDVIRLSNRLGGKPEKEVGDLRRNLFPTLFSFFVGSTFEGAPRELEDYWNESQGNLRLGAPAADGWIAEFGQHREKYDNPDSWANSFEQQYGANGWASEFEQSQLSSVDQMRGMNMSNFAAMEQTRMLANTLAQNNDPKFQNSKFLQFVSKMSRGELIIDDNQVKENSLPSSGDWATEYNQQYNQGHTWAGEFLQDKVYNGPDQWANEFTTEGWQHDAVDDQWLNEFSKLNVNDWADEFGKQIGEGAIGDSTSDSWAQAYDEFLNEQVAAKQQLDSSRGVYVFSDLNPYVGRPNPLKEGQDLFRKGLLSEAVLAFEAEVLKNPENAEGWRLLGIAHAENDDDQQAIAAMMRAQEADPTNLEVLLALGVSHTNELEQQAALKYLYGWLRHHPKYGTLAPPEMPDSLYYTDVARLFNEAAVLSPDDADVHIVLGVMYNLSREYDKAITSFERALQLKPQDYSLWNKLGATQANSVQSADAIKAYQQALDLKPNYVRAWANMGISYANQSMYDESIRYYVRALAMNPKAENAWQYLRISLSCASRNDMLEACDSRNLDLLQKEFPLQ